MFCRKCGTKLGDSDMFCQSCGTQIQNSDTAEATTNINKTVMEQRAPVGGTPVSGQSSGPVNPAFMGNTAEGGGYQSTAMSGSTKRLINFICANAAILITFTLGWIKAKGYAGDFLDFGFGGSENSLSPSQVLKLFLEAKDSYFGIYMPESYNILYLLAVIPIGAGLAILLALIKKNLWASRMAIISAIFTFLAFAAAIILLAEYDYLGFKTGAFLAIAAAIYSIIAAKSIGKRAKNPGFYYEG